MTGDKYRRDKSSTKNIEVAEKSVVHIFKKYRDYFIGAFVVWSVGSVYKTIFPPSTQAFLPQTSYGDHCPHRLFEDIADTHYEIVFIPESLKNISVCGSGKYDGSSNKEKVLDYLQVKQNRCFHTKTDNNKLTITPYTKNEKNSGADGETRIIGINKNGDNLYACFCDERQDELIMEAAVKNGNFCKLAL